MSQPAMPRAPHRPDLSREAAAQARGLRQVAGVDEAGRGPLAGPVVAAAVILDPAALPEALLLGLDDSKKLTAKRREALAPLIRSTCRWALGAASVAEIDALNILRASHLAMCRALTGLLVAPDFVLIDGNLLPADLPCRGEAVIGGDALSLSIAAASILAKVERDRIMQDLDAMFPAYGWARNMGYPSAAHRAALAEHGPTPHHRRSFAPVRAAIARKLC